MNDLIHFATNEFGIPVLQQEFDHMGYMTDCHPTSREGKNKCYFQE